MCQGVDEANRREMQMNVAILGTGINPVSGKFGVKLWRRPNNRTWWVFGGKARRLWALYERHGDCKYGAAKG
jgi:hypothetical protein